MVSWEEVDLDDPDIQWTLKDYITSLNRKLENMDRLLSDHQSAIYELRGRLNIYDRLAREVSNVPS